MACTYALHCFSCGNELSIRDNRGFTSAFRQLEKKADGLGWGLALTEIGDIYVCPACAPSFTTFYQMPKPRMPLILPSAP